MLLFDNTSFSSSKNLQILIAKILSTNRFDKARFLSWYFRATGLTQIITNFEQKSANLDKIYFLIVLFTAFCVIFNKP